MTLDGQVVLELMVVVSRLSKRKVDHRVRIGGRQSSLDYDALNLLGFL